MNEEKITKAIVILLVIIVLILIIFCVIKSINNNRIIGENAFDIKEVERKINEEFEYYEKVKENYRTDTTVPYLPDEFYYVEGNVEDGYVIEDKNKNQYVWVPCIKEKNDLKKNDFTDVPFISYEECYDEKYKDFINSVLENGGFYISRYQIGKQNNIPVSKKDVEFWTVYNLNEAKEIVNSMHTNTDYNHEIINGFAYDMTLNWILKDNELVIRKESLKTGEKAYKNIYDMLDSNYEITLEKSYSNTIIYRGFLDFELNGIIGEGIELDKKDNRWIFIEDRDKVENLGIRTILYK